MIYLNFGSMKNTIAERVADFMKGFPPFDKLTSSQLILVAQQVSIIYVQKDKVIYNQGSVLQEHFYLIHKGAVTLQKELDGRIKRLDKLDEGDVFGLRPLFAKENYAISALGTEESILYAVPIEVFKPIAEQNREVSKFLLESFASNTESPYMSPPDLDIFIEEYGHQPLEQELFEFQPAPYVKHVVTSSPETSASDIALLMREGHVSSVIITKNQIPLGIVTSKQIRNHIATGDLPFDTPAAELMTSPVLCYPKSVTIAQAQSSMIKHDVRFLCITKDGTPHSKLIGILSHHDIAVRKGANPAALMRAIKHAGSTKELQKIRESIQLLLEGYLQQGIPLTHFSKIIFELNDATIKRIISRCIAKLNTAPPVQFAWMSLGSQGRKEQLLTTDQDNALVFEDVAPNEIENVRAYFLILARKVNKRLKKIGFEYCVVDTMARNPSWCLTLTEWKEQFSKWSSDTGSDEILLCSIFFDFDISYGDVRLTDKLASHIFEITQNNPMFISKLATSSLRSPSPFGFFRQFLVENDGEYKDQFDLKTRGLTPMIDAGRVLALQFQMRGINNTAERFEKLAELDSANESLFLSCSFAFKAMLKFRVKHGLMNQNSGRFIELSVMTKEEKMKLKRSFKTLARLQNFIKTRFNVNPYA
jgi:CBS domain-containing protein